MLQSKAKFEEKDGGRSGDRRYFVFADFFKVYLFLEREREKVCFPVSRGGAERERQRDRIQGSL